jgi:predicted enzyme related to lactoylglutathione lyase
MANSVVHFEVTGQDLEKLEGFYRDLFDWKVQDVPEMNYAMVEKEGDGIAGGIGRSPDGGPGHVTFYVGVDELQPVLDRAEQLGGKTVMPPMDLPQVSIALFADPEGHVIGLAKSN